MTGAFDEWFFDSPEQVAARAQAAIEQAEGERRTVAELLAARGHRWAAALVAMSSLESLRVDNWNGGQYEAHLDVPVSLYDRVTDEIREQVSAAVEVVYGADCYRGLQVGVRRADFRDGWDREFMEALTAQARAEQAAAPVEPSALPPGT